MARFDVPTVFPVTAGDYERVKFELLQPKENESDPDVPQSIEGWTLRFGAKFDISDATPLVSKNSIDDPDSFEIVDAANGIGYIVLKPEDLQSAITYETVLICDLVAEDETGKPYTSRFFLPVEMGVTT